MKFEIKLSWASVLYKARIVFLVIVFGALYHYVGEIAAFVWALYFIFNDLSEIVNDIDEIKETREKAWKGISHKRKGF